MKTIYSRKYKLIDSNRHNSKPMLSIGLKQIKDLHPAFFLFKRFIVPSSFKEDKLWMYLLSLELSS